MAKAKSRINKKEKYHGFIALLIITDALLWILVFTAIFRVRQIETIVYIPQEVQVKEVEKPKPEYIPSENTLKLMDKKPGMTGQIYDFYHKKHGGDWRKWAELIARESGFNQYAINPTSGACGLSQSLPCDKMKCDLSDAKCQLKWIEDYVTRRYGSIDNALLWHDRNNYY